MIEAFDLGDHFVERSSPIFGGKTHQRAEEAIGVVVGICAERDRSARGELEALQDFGTHVSGIPKCGRSPLPLEPLAPKAARNWPRFIR